MTLRAVERYVPDRSRLGFVLDRHSGVLHLQQLLEAGYSRQQVAAMFRTGQLLRPRIGWYCSPELPDDAVRAIRVGGALGCVSAAASWGLALPEGEPDHLHVSLDEHTSRLRSSSDPTWRVQAGDEEHVRWHWEGRLELADGYRVGVADTLIQMSACVSADWLTAAVDSALRPRPHTRWPLLNTANKERLRAAVPRSLRDAIDLADGRSESPGESFARFGLLAAGIPFRLQVPVTSLYRADILLDEWLVIEIDGSAHHSGPEAFMSDRERDSMMAWYGYRVLRFTYHQVLYNWAFVLDVIQRVRAGGRPAKVG